MLFSLIYSVRAFDKVNLSISYSYHKNVFVFHDHFKNKRIRNNILTNNGQIKIDYILEMRLNESFVSGLTGIFAAVYAIFKAILAMSSLFSKSPELY